MATLTTSWQNIASYVWTLSGYNTKVTFYLDAKYSSQSIGNNSTDIQTRLNCVLNQGSVSGSGYNYTCSYAPTVSGSGVWNFETETITSGSGTVYHNSDGTKSLTLSATAKNSYWGLNASMSATVSLPSIPRQANLSTAQDFTDEGNPTITYSNPAGNSVSALKAYIEKDSSTLLVGLRDVNKTGTLSYTFNFTAAERATLRQYCTGNSMPVRFVLQTTIGGSNYWSVITKTMTIVNGNPTFTNITSVTDNNDTTFDLTNDVNKFIKGYSNALVVIDTNDKAVANKEATMTNYIVNGTSRTYAQYFTDTIYGISTNTVTVQASDSRGNSKSVSKTIDLINYFPVSNNNNNITVTRQNNVGSVTTASFSGSWWNSNFRNGNLNSINPGDVLSGTKLEMDFSNLTYQVVDAAGIPTYQEIVRSENGYVIQLNIYKTRAAGPSGNHAYIDLLWDDNGTKHYIDTLWLAYEDGTIDTDLTEYDLADGFGSSMLTRPEKFGMVTAIDPTSVAYPMIKYLNTINNALSISYRYKRTDSSTWITGTAPTLTTSGNTFSFNGYLIGDQVDNGFDIDEAYNIEITISDALSSTTYTATLNSGKPAIAVYKNKVSIGSRYDTTLGGKLQVDGYLVCCYEVVDNL